MICPKCGIEAFGKFCGHCGTATGEGSGVHVAGPAEVQALDMSLHGAATATPSPGPSESDALRITPNQAVIPSINQTAGSPPTPLSVQEPDAESPPQTALRRLTASVSRRNRYILSGSFTVVALIIAVLILNNPGPKTIFNAAVGECLNKVPEKSISSVALSVPCRDSHALEVYFTTTYSGESFPGTAILENFTQGACSDNFAAYVGVGPDESDFNFVYITPDQKEWSDGTRTMMCALAPDDNGYSYGSERASG